MNGDGYADIAVGAFEADPANGVVFIYGGGPKIDGSYDAYFDLKDKGKYQVLILFKVGEEKRTAGIYYEIK